MRDYASDVIKALRSIPDPEQPLFSFRDARRVLDASAALLTEAQTTKQIAFVQRPGATYHSAEALAVYIEATERQFDSRQAATAREAINAAVRLASR